MRDAIRPADPLSNFGGNIQFTPRQLHAPSSAEEVLAILDQHAHGKVRVAGALHAWSPAVVCADAIVDLRHFDSVQVEYGSDGAVWATVGGGCRIKHLLRKLHALADATVPTLGLITEQTIAGAIATATHGSGKHSLSHYIDELRVAAYDPVTGKARVYTWNAGAELQAARCALGCMGIILTVRFRCVPKYEVAEIMVFCPSLDNVLAAEDEFQLQQFYLAPHLWSYFAQRRRMLPDFRPRRRLSAKFYRLWWFCCIDLTLHVIIKLLASILRSPSLTRFFFRHVLAKTVLRNITFVDHSERMLVMEHELFKHLEIEIFVPARNLRAAAAFVQDVVQVFDGARGPDRQSGQPTFDALEAIGMREELDQYRGSFTHHYPIAFRRVLPDDALISMSSGAEPYYAISFITYVEPRDRFFTMASFLARSMTRLFQARLHWGKYFPLTNADIEGVYPRLPEFRARCRQVDPNGVFRNDFTDAVLFGAG